MIRNTSSLLEALNYRLKTLCQHFELSSIIILVKNQTNYSTWKIHILDFIKDFIMSVDELNSILHKREDESLASCLRNFGGWKRTSMQFGTCVVRSFTCVSCDLACPNGPVASRIGSNELFRIWVSWAMFFKTTESEQRASHRQTPDWTSLSSDAGE